MMQTVECPIVDRVHAVELDEKEIRFYRQEGYLYLPGLLRPADSKAAAEEVLEIVNVAAQITGPLARGRDGRPLKLVQSSQYLRGSVLDGLVNSPSLHAIASALLGGEACLYLPFTAVKSGGGGGAFNFHQDNQYTRYVNGLHGVNIWFALTDMTPENGCLQMCPRSHLRGTFEAAEVGDGHRKMKIDPDDFLPVRMRAGDAIAFSRLTVHGSGTNATDRPRIAYGIQFNHVDAQAVWDNQPPRPLKNANRWSTGPVAELTPPAEAGRDGH